MNSDCLRYHLFRYNKDIRDTKDTRETKNFRYPKRIRDTEDIRDTEEIRDNRIYSVLQKTSNIRDKNF